MIRSCSLSVVGPPKRVAKTRQTPRGVFGIHNRKCPPEYKKMKNEEVSMASYSHMLEKMKKLM